MNISFGISIHLTTCFTCGYNKAIVRFVWPEYEHQRSLMLCEYYCKRCENCIEIDRKSEFGRFIEFELGNIKDLDAGELKRYEFYEDDKQSYNFTIKSEKSNTIKMNYEPKTKKKSKKKL